VGVRFSVHGRLAALEVARGYDGVFRRAIDPVLLVAFYASVGGVVRTVGRSLHRFEPQKPYPSSVAPDVVELPTTTVDVDIGDSLIAPPLRFVALAIALEQDGGEDVQRLFGALDHQELLSIWRTNQQDPEPLSIAAVGHGSGWAGPAKVEILVNNVAASKCASDKWIGAVCWTMRGRAPPQTSVQRLPFLSPDGKNDWTALVELAH
jgi:hypothetical protein